jgi:hypothetical protein
MSAGYPNRRDGCLLCELADVLEAREYALADLADRADVVDQGSGWAEADRAWQAVYGDRVRLGKMHAPGPNRDLL